MGVDPGYGDTGVGFIQSKAGIYTYLSCDVISTKAKTPMQERLQKIYEELSALIGRGKPDLIAVEKLYFAQNVTTAMAVAQARGVVLLVAAQASVPIVEFTPLEVKQALTSYGRADKRDVARMVRTILSEPQLRAQNDAIDALAIALCAAFRNRQYA